MSSDRLTRRELSWLLTQEAKGAADRLREGVQILTREADATAGSEPPPPSDRASKSERPITLSSTGGGAEGLESTLNALDEAMQQLSEISGPASGTRGRRGRIDLGALLWELAPGARVQLEPGAGTEVFGEESELRRMLHVLLGGSAAGATPQVVSVRRDGSDVRLVVDLGPDTAPISPAERAWLSRMSIRYGGRYELDGNHECLIFPALQAEEQKEVLTLRRELEAAKAQGEAYARELAAVFAEEPAQASRPPGPGESAYESLAICARVAEAMADDLRAAFGPLGAARLRAGSGEALGEEVQRTLARGADLLSVARQMARVASGVGPITVDLAVLAHDEATLASVAFAARSVVLTLAAAEAPEPMVVQGMPTALRAMVAEMLDCALRACSGPSEVRMYVQGSSLVVELSGLAVRSLTAGGLTAQAFLQEIARAHGLRLEVEDKRLRVVLPPSP